jgi:hypothetical protein
MRTLTHAHNMSEQSEVFQFPSSLDEMDEDLVRAHGLPFWPVLVFDAQRVRTLEEKLLLEASTVQWLITWWRTLHGSVRIVRPTDERPLDSLRRISDTLPGVVVGLLPEPAVEQIPRQPLAKFRDAYLKQQLSWPDLNVHAHASLLCVDAMPAETGLPPLLYPDRRTHKVADRDRFSIVTDKLIASVTQETNIRGAISAHRDRLTTILHELFKNTHDHARTNTDRTPLELSIRGIYSRFYSADHLTAVLPEAHKNKQSNDDHSKDAQNKNLPIRNQVEQYASFFLTAGRQRPEGLRPKSLANFLGLLELSIFDSGPGFAATYLKDRFDTASVQDQFDAVLGCFQTGRSSTEDDSRGYGLWKVLRDLRAMKGLIRVRTNRINVYRDFARFEDMWIKKGDVVAPEERLLDWKRGLTSKIDEGYPDVQGAYISILIPLGDGL